MNEYPDWVELVSYLGLDPITVWIEYRFLLYAGLILLTALVLTGLYWVALRARSVIANYKHSFADRMAFYRSIYDMEEHLHEPLFAALGGEPLVYAVPAVAAEDVPGFRKSVGHVLLTRTKLIFASNGQKIEFPLGSFNDANVKDGKKYMELKLIFDKRKPQFHLLGISRDHAQEIFMKMHAFRVAIRETNPSPETTL